MSGRVVGILPAAGYATRLQPLEGSKEVYEIGGRPLIDHLVERMRAAPCDELRVVTRPEKRDVVEHARELEARVVEGRPETLAQSLALGLDGLEPDDVALIGFPDTIWEAEDVFPRLLEALDEETEAALGLFTYPEPERSDVVTVDESGRVTTVAVKPERPASSLVWGCAAARVSALAGLDRRDWPGEHFQDLARQGRVGSVRFQGEFLDVGTRTALRKARAKFAH
jgi:glucose-1-phosphate thymidylyltransferase